MGIFETIKQNTDVPSVAGRYGVSVKRNGFTNCIFHSDKHPSMKLYKDHYHCFACGAHGDAVSFTAQLFGLSPYEAAKKIAVDFGIAYDVGNSVSRTFPHRSKTDEAVELLSEYIGILEKNKIKYAPEFPDEEYHPLYEESLQLLPLYKYYREILTTGNKDERNEILKERRFFNELRAKIRRAGMAG